MIQALKAMTKTLSAIESWNNFRVDFAEMTDAELLQAAESVGTFSDLDGQEENIYNV